MIERDDAFWNTAYRSHGPAVMAFLLRRVHRRAEAEDLLQETFVRAMRVEGFRQDSNVRAYLLSTARNLWINQIRRPRLVVPEERADDDAPSFPEIVGETARAGEEAAWILFRRKLDDVLGQMSDDHRRAFELAVFDQLSYAEIAAETGWSIPRVKTNVFRARKKLVETLGDDAADLRGPRP